MQADDNNHKTLKPHAYVYDQRHDEQNRDAVAHPA